MATTVYKRSGLTGGAATDLDGQDGAALVDGDFAFVLTGSAFYVYLLDEDSGAAESSPTVIAPDTNAGDKRWINQSVSNVTSGVTPPSGVEVTGNISGMVTSNHTDTDHDISISAGACFDSTNVFHMSNSSAVVKQIDAPWAAGSAAGGLLNGSVAANTLYHVYALRKDADGTADFGFLKYTDSIATYKPAGYTYYRWIGYEVTDASANIRNSTMVDSWKEFESAYALFTSAPSAYALTSLVGKTPTSKASEMVVGVGGADVETATIGNTATEASLGLKPYNGVVTWATLLTQHQTSPSIATVRLTPASGIYFSYTGIGSPTMLVKAVKIIR